MSYIDIKTFKYAVGKIDDGFIFESFAKSFLGGVLGYDFMPVGGVKDKGIDAFKYSYYRNGFIKQIYQFSTERNQKNKIEDTINKLKKNKVDFDSLYYVTNRKVLNMDKLCDELFDSYNKPIKIYDIEWFAIHANDSVTTSRAYNTFIASYYHEFNKPGKSGIVSNLDKDARLFVFLRQQVDANGENIKFEKLLADSLILYSLEGTDPGKKIFKTSIEIKNEIRSYIKFDPKIIESTIDERLKVLSTKPRKINYHTKQKAYVLPYETRLEIQKRNIEDNHLQDEFYDKTEKTIKKYLSTSKTVVHNLLKLIDEIIHKIFYQQGLEFANFVLHGECEDIIENDLQEIINLVVDESSIVERNIGSVKTALLMAIRDIVYNGTKEQKRYFRSLSRTYLIMFLLNWDPKIATYFEAMTPQLDVIVCNSIIIPALSEYYLKLENRRFWSLLKSANNAGINLYVEDNIIDELIMHFKMIYKKYKDFFKLNENIYLGDELQTLYIDDILIRAYFYAKTRGQISNFNDFIENFVNSDFNTIKEDLIQYLSDEFGIKYLSTDDLNIQIDEKEYNLLFTELKELKKYQEKAKYDARLILTIFKLREKKSEINTASIFGYKTWWLSSDIKTFVAVRKAFKDKYKISCYMRPDFLYNYVTLAPKKHEIDQAYKELFPSLIGINISFHLPKEITSFVQKTINEYRAKNPNSVRRILRRLSEQLKSDPSIRNRKYVKLFLDQELSKIVNNDH